MRGRTSSDRPVSAPARVRPGADFVAGGGGQVDTGGRDGIARPRSFLNLLVIGFLIGSGADLKAQPAEAPLPPLHLGFGSGPRAVANGRMVESIFHLYMRPNAWLERLEDDPTSRTARALRLAKFPIDAYVSNLHTLLLHEFGHAEAAWLNGASAAWERTPAGVAGAFGRWVVYSSPDGLSSRRYAAMTAGGFDATGAAFEDLSVRMLGRDRIEYSYLPLLLSYKLDLSRYVLDMPRPGHETRAHAGNDAVNYLRNQAVSSGNTPSSIHRTMRRGAILNVLDPVFLWAAYQYGDGFLWNGRQEFHNPMMSPGSGWKLYAGTGFWLSEIGPRYRLRAIFRRAGTMIRVVPSWGDGGQWSFEGRIRNRLSDRVVSHLSGAVWSQRDLPDPGPNRGGGSIGAGVTTAIGEKTAVEVVAEYKTAGALLGRDFQRGPHLRIGLAYGR